MQVVKVGDAHLHVAARLPPGRPVVAFIHALGADFRIWDDVAARLQGAGYATLLYDLRGHGLSDLGTPPRRIDDHVDDLLGLLEAFAIPQAHIAGVSVGGQIALGLAGRRPQAILSLALCCTGARIGTPEAWNARIAAVEGGGVASVAEAVLQRWFPPAEYSRDGALPAMCRNMLSRSSAAGYNATCVALRDSDLTAAARAIAAPTLCVGGEFDTSTPPAMVRELVGLIPGARYVEIAGAGHLPCLQAPQALSRELIAHFAATG